MVSKRGTGVVYNTAVCLFLIQTESSCPIYAELKDIAQEKKRVREMKERMKKSDEFTEKKET